MATLHITTILDSALLLERAVDGLFPLEPASAERPWPTLGAWVVLRQGGLRDDLLRLAAGRGVTGWFDAPVCLFNEIEERWGSDAQPPPLDDAEREAVVSALLAEHAGALFHGASGFESWVPAVDRLIGELISEGIAPAEFARALAATTEGRTEAIREAVLSHVYADWVTVLARDGRVDGRDAKVRLARAISDGDPGFADRLGGRREIRIVGLADLRGGWRPLLRALASSRALDRVEVIASSAIEIEGAEERTVPAETLTFAAALFTERTPIAGPQVSLLEAPDSARELEHVAVRVRALVDAGVDAREIAVIAREARPTVDAMAAALGRIGVPVTARRRTALGQTAPGRALTAILRAASADWSRHSIAELAEHPLLRTGLDARVVNQVGYASAIGSLAGWHDGLAALLTLCEERALAVGEAEERRAPLPSLERVRATVDAWEKLAPALEALTVARELGAWCAWITETLDADAWGIATRLREPCADHEVWRADLRARDAIVSIAASWRQASARFGAAGSVISAAEFAERFALMLSQDLITPPLTDFGVVVAEALAAGWRSFAHLFVVGLSAGAFPRRPAAGPLFDPRERRALELVGLALDPVDAWRAREQELFRVLCAGARETLTLSWPAMDADGREVARSTYVDEAASVLARRDGIAAGDDQDMALIASGTLRRIATHEQLVPGFPVVTNAAGFRQAQEGALRERAREADATLAVNPWNGLIEDPVLSADLATRYGESYVWSATQLEEAAKCRWLWFAARQLRLETRTDADDLMEPTTRGIILHEALEHFFKTCAAAFGAPVFLRTGDAPRASTMLDTALRDAWSAMEASGIWLGPVATHASTRVELATELQGYLAFEIDWNEKSFNNRTTSSKNVRTGSVEGEFAFDRVPLRGGGVSFLLRGKVDRVDRGIEGPDESLPGAKRFVAAIDYKSTIYSTPGEGKGSAWDDGIVLQVPLYAAALRVARPDDEVARMEYRTIRGPKAVHQLTLVQVKKGEVQDAAAAEEKLGAALAAAGAKIAQLRRGELPGVPTPTAGCSRYCPARDVCRIPGGPRDGPP